MAQECTGRASMPAVSWLSPDVFKKGVTSIQSHANGSPLGSQKEFRRPLSRVYRSGRGREAYHQEKRLGQRPAASADHATTLKKRNRRKQRKRRGWLCCLP